uniref:Uncharacterized protein n=1 Tax=Globodera pallida TaxID=36090 RepID=A0A183CD24_GLOPA
MQIRRYGMEHYATREIQKSEWHCVCSLGEKYEEMAFTLPPTPAPVTTTTKKPTKAPKPTTSTTKPSKGHRLVAEEFCHFSMTCSPCFTATTSNN